MSRSHAIESSRYNARRAASTKQLLAKDWSEAERIRSVSVTFLRTITKQSDDLVLRMHSIEALKPPQPRNFGSFSNWIRVKNQFTTDDASFLDRGEDFIALTDDYEYGLLDSIVEKFISGCTPRNVYFERVLDQFCG